jgi:HK97 family phage prohead protease
MSPKKPHTTRARLAGRLEQRAQLRGTTEVRKFSATVAGGRVVRTSMTSDGVEITGTPMVYSVAYTVHDALGSFQETMLPGVVAEILGTCDTRFLVNHSREMIPLARTASRTLRLSDGPDALRFSATLDKRQSLANDLAVAIERGDISQMSVGFVVGKDSWSDDYSTRTIRSISELLDVSAVTYPASPTTSIALTNGNGMTTNSARSASVTRTRDLTLRAEAGRRR